MVIRQRFRGGSGAGGKKMVSPPGIWTAEPRQLVIKIAPVAST
jgi:hypothetical protein